MYVDLDSVRTMGHDRAVPGDGPASSPEKSCSDVDVDSLIMISHFLRTATALPARRTSTQ